MKLTTGVDLIEISRIAAAVDEHGERFLRRTFTPAEVDSCAGRVESLAARFAAKEAVAKALGTGIRDFSFLDIEVIKGNLGQPQVKLHGGAKTLADSLGLANWSISLSHDKTHAIAQVVAWGE